jgi:hypothetical protein
VEKREEADDEDIGSRPRCEQEAVAFDALPMRRSMEMIVRSVVLIADELPERAKRVVYRLR